MEEAHGTSASATQISQANGGKETFLNP